MRRIGSRSTTITCSAANGRLESKLVAIIRAIVVCWTIVIGIALCRAEPPGKEATSSIGMKLMLIPSGDFLMGSGETSPEILKDYPQSHHPADYFDDERPQ